MFSSWLIKNYRKFFAPIIAFGIILLFIFPIPNKNSTTEGELIVPPTSADIQPKFSEEENQKSEESLDFVVIDVKGMVKYPGVYHLPEGSRIVDAIEIAGGYLPESDSATINHAQKLNDEMVIYIPYKGEEVVTAVSRPSEHDDGLIDINTADESLLTTLPGIGPAKALSIISYREENGPFAAPEDIKKVTGIGDKTYERLEGLIKVK